MKISRSETEYVWNDKETGGTVKMQRTKQVVIVDEFQYLGSIIQEKKNGQCPSKLKEDQQKVENVTIFTVCDPDGYEISI